jgi:phosphoglycolate phosphatase-like HAD superfamily hydrolase
LFAPEGVERQEEAMIQGVLCTLDGFLVERSQTIPLPGVVDTLAALRERGIRVAVAANQAGPLWRAVTGQEHYPTAEQVADRLREANAHLGLGQSPWYVSLYDGRALRLLRASELDEVLRGMPERLLEMMAEMQVHASAYPTWRTPEPGMLLAACEAWGIEPSEAVFGGEQDADRQAAAVAGMRFALTLSEVLALVENEA